MSEPLKNKIDFAVIIAVDHANPNGDPLNGNRPRQTYDRLGEISDVCLKRKLRNRLQDMGKCIFVQSDDNRADGDNFRALNERYEAASKSEAWDPRKDSCATWFDVRAFGQVFAFKAKKGKKNKGKSKSDENGDENQDNAASVSIGIRGPVTIQSAYSLEPINSDSIQITKSVNLETDQNNPDKKGGDTMGMKHRVNHGVYVAYGSINPHLASKTGFSDDDAEKVKLALQSLFENDESSARPAGSMSVQQVVWWQHNSICGQYSSADVHNALRKVLKADGTFDEQAVKEKTPNLTPSFLNQLEGEELATLKKA